MNHLESKRTPLVIAAEINTITHQTKKILLTSAVEIGRRLKEAKSLVDHGEWGKWLEESVNYSRSTAANLMRLYEKYGQNITEDDPNLQLVANLTYTQALLLLGLPEEEREEFIASNDVAGMTKQELQQVIKDRDQAKREKDKALQEKNEAIQQNEALQKGLEAIDGTLAELKREQVKDRPRPGATAETAVGADTSLTGQTFSELPVGITHNLPTQRDPDDAVKFAKQCDTCREIIVNTFSDLIRALTNLNHIDVNLKEKKRKEAQRLLDALAAQIKEFPPKIKFIDSR